jgi:hypothetical protein
MVVLGDLAGLNYNGPTDEIRLDNRLIRVGPGVPGGELVWEFYDGTAWRTRAIGILVAGVGIAGWQVVTILDNRPEQVSARYEYGETAGGRVTLDVTLRRGMRTAMCLLSRNAAALLGLMCFAPMTATGARMREDTADGNGHRLVFVSPRSYTPGPATGAMLSATSVTSFAFFIGLERSGAGAGDLAVDLMNQSLGYLAEEVRAVRR